MSIIFAILSVQQALLPLHSPVQRVAYQQHWAHWDLTVTFIENKNKPQKHFWLVSVILQWGSHIVGVLLPPHLSKSINDFLYPLFQAEHMCVETILPISVTAFTPWDNAHLIPAVVIGALRKNGGDSKSQVQAVAANKFPPPPTFPTTRILPTSPWPLEKLTFMTKGPPLSPSQASPLLVSFTLKPWGRTAGFRNHLSYYSPRTPTWPQDGYPDLISSC